LKTDRHDLIVQNVHPLEKRSMIDLYQYLTLENRLPKQNFLPALNDYIGEAKINLLLQKDATFYINSA